MPDLAAVDSCVASKSPPDQKNDRDVYLITGIVMHRRCTTQCRASAYHRFCEIGAHEGGSDRTAGHMARGRDHLPINRPVQTKS